MSARADTLWADLRACGSFFTRLPFGYPHTKRPFADALWAAPVIGHGIGLLVAAAFSLALGFGLPPGPSAALALGCGLLLTGALHEDGLADVADGFGGGRDRGAKLAIMKDSRIGTYGALALGLSLLARWSALGALAPAPAERLFLVLAAAHAASRALLAAMLHVLPSARGTGLSAGVGAVGSGTALAALLFGFLALLPLGLSFALAAAALLASVFLGLALLAKQQIGGQTGDVLGALQQGGEIAVLLIAAAFFK